MYRSYQKIKRRKSKSLKIGEVEIGGDAPISVQTMTNTNTSDVKSTIDQIERITRVGADFVDLAFPSDLLTGVSTSDGPTSLAPAKFTPQIVQ